MLNLDQRVLRHAILESMRNSSMTATTTANKLAGRRGLVACKHAYDSLSSVVVVVVRVADKWRTPSWMRRHILESLHNSRRATRSPRTTQRNAAPVAGRSDSVCAVCVFRWENIVGRCGQYVYITLTHRWNRVRLSHRGQVYYSVICLCAFAFVLKKRWIFFLSVWLKVLIVLKANGSES